MKKSIVIFPLILILFMLIRGKKDSEYVSNSFNQQMFPERSLDNKYTVKTEFTRWNHKKEKKEAKNKKYFQIEQEENPDKYNKQWKLVQEIHTENDAETSVNSWFYMGPFGIREYSNLIGSGTYYETGRITDYEIRNRRASSCMGGLWQHNISFPVAVPVPLSDKVNCLSIGSFTSHPSDSTKIFIGTGEPAGPRGFGINVGTGLWKTVNNGLNWSQVTMSPTPNAFYKIRYVPGDTNIIYAATTQGFYRSQNGGNNWTRTITGNICDFDVDPSYNNWVYAAEWGVGLKYSSDYGINWVSNYTSGFPSTDVSRINIAIAPSLSSYMYANVVASDNNTRGLYRSTDYGFTWVQTYTGLSFHWGQGDYNNSISVSPVNHNLVLAGGGSIQRSANAGVSWFEIHPYSGYMIHNDHHRIVWDAGGSYVYSCNDGGLWVSTNQGVTWGSGSNNFPITQFYSGDAGVNNLNVFVGGTQDNASPYSINNGSNWFWGPIGDGQGAVISPNNANIFICSGNSQAFRTTNAGVNFINGLSGIDPGSGYFGFASDKYFSSTRLACFKDFYTYSSSNSGQSWVKLNPTNPWPVTTRNITVEKGSSAGDYVIYVALWDGNSQANKIKVYINGGWYENSNGLPDICNVNKVAVHPRLQQIAYAIVRNNAASNQKIYKTTNRGFNWINITGNLQDVPVTDLIAHPTDNNILVISTNMYGFFKTTTGGANWFSWNNGIPAATSCEAMTYQDLQGAGLFYVIAATNGRGFIKREMNDDDPVGIVNNNAPAKYVLSQNFPNPFNPGTNVKFSIPADGNVKLTVFDITGREVKVLADEIMSAGSYEIYFNGEGISTGIYFYRLEVTGKYGLNFSDTKKMILVK